jgi:hypothetical protein
MTEGQKLAFCRVVIRGRSPALACHDLGCTTDDLLYAMVDDHGFCAEAMYAILYLSHVTFEERFTAD